MPKLFYALISQPTNAKINFMPNCIKIGINQPAN